MRCNLISLTAGKVAIKFHGQKHCGRTILLLQSRQDQAVHADRALDSLSVHYNATFIDARARFNLNRGTQRDKTKCEDGANSFLILIGCLGPLLLLRNHLDVYNFWDQQ